MTRSLIETYRQLPRAARWAALAALGITLFLAWDGMSAVAGRWSLEADTMLASVSRAAGSEQRLQTLRRMRDSVRALGSVHPPRDAELAEAALYDVVNAVIKRHTVTDDSFNYRGPTKMPRGTLARILSPGQQVEKISGDLRFDATPEQAVAIVAALEADPQIEAVSSVRLTKGAGPGKVTVDITLEAWIVSAAAGASGIGGGA